MKNKKTILLLLIFCMAFTMTAPAALALNDPIIPAPAAVLIDLNSGRVLYGKNMNEQRAPASLTKVMTVLLTLEAIRNGEISMDDRVVAQNDCRYLMEDDSSTSGIMPGTEVSVRELLYCALLQSANESCNILATHIAGSIDAFVERMNARARELGCVNTHFVTTNGLPADNHYSTAYDLALITQAAIAYPEFLTMCNTLSYTPESQGVNGGKTMYNTNALITDQSIYGSNYVYQYASGVKTGYTRAAGYCLISTAEKDGVRTLAVVLGCDGLSNANIDKYRNFEASIDLYEWAFRNFSYRILLSPYNMVESVPIAYAKNGVQAELYPQDSIIALAPNDLDFRSINISVTVYEDQLTAPIAAGTVLGEVTVYIDDQNCGTVCLVNTDNIELSRIEYMRAKVAEVFSSRFVVICLVAIGLFLVAHFVRVISYRAKRRKYWRMRQRQLAEKRRRQQVMEEEQERSIR